MKERPLLFNGAMVRAILDGSKTQTRRIVKRTEGRRISGFNKYPAPDVPNGMESWTSLEGNDIWMGTCPYGQSEERIWARETARVLNYIDQENRERRANVRYEADGKESVVIIPGRLKPITPGKCIPNGCHREAARIWLEITGVRVERLQDISEEDALAEGITSDTIIVGANCHGGRHTEEHAERYFYEGCQDEGFDSAVDAYGALWKSIYGKESWDANPWLWVIDFRRVRP